MTLWTYTAIVLSGHEVRGGEGEAKEIGVKSN